MTMSQTSVPTAYASRYLQQLCKHWSHKFETAFDAKAGTIHFDSDRAVALVADDATLKMKLTTPDAETNMRMQTVVAEHLKRFAFREDLVVDWTNKA